MPAPERQEFRIEAAPGLDVLLRILGPFAVQGAELVDVRHALTDEGAWTILEATGLEGEGADLLRLRLLQVPSVRGVWLRPCLALVGAAK